MKLSLEKQKKIALTLLVVVGVNFGAYWFGIQGLAGKRDSDTKKVEDLKSDIKKRTDEIAGELDSRGKARVFQDYIAIMEKQMPKGKTDTWLDNQMSQILAKHQLQISNPSVKPLDEFTHFLFKDQPYKLVGFQFEFVGELNQIGGFIEDIENNRPLMEVHDLNISAGGGGPSHLHRVVVHFSIVDDQG